MGTRFTDRAQRVILIAQEEAKRLSHDCVDRQHVLLGIIALSEGTAFQLLERYRINIRKLRASIETALSEGDSEMLLGEVPFTPESKKSLELAVEEAQRLSHTYIGTEHLLLGLLHFKEIVELPEFANNNVTLEGARNSLREILGETTEESDGARGDATVGDYEKNTGLGNDSENEFTGEHPQALGADLPKEDLLGRQGLVKSIAAMLKDSGQTTPLNIAILGDWGSGKSSVMKLLADELHQTSPDQFYFANFNAWEYELTGNMAAGLAQEVVEGILECMRWKKLPQWMNVRLWWVVSEYLFIKYKVQILQLLITSALVLLAYINIPQSIRDIWFSRFIEFVDPIMPIAGLGLGLGFFAFLIYGVGRVVTHPFAVNLKTYLKLPCYQKHLGLTPVIKKDIQDLTSIVLGEPWFCKYIRLINKKSWFGTDCWQRIGQVRPKRLIVFIDDLDRCDYACVVQTLDAVRLIMDFENVVTVIGIDDRIALKAISKKYDNVSDKEHSPSDIARDYLGKIIQLPIRLQNPTTKDLSAFIEKRLFGLNKHISKIGKTSATEYYEGFSFEEHRYGQRVRGDTAPVGGADADMANFEKDATTIISELPGIDAVMQHNQEEKEWFNYFVAAYKLSNPRQLVRLYNGYGLLKLLDNWRCINQNKTRLFPRSELMRILFFQDVLHAIPHHFQLKVEKLVEGDILKPDYVRDLPEHIGKKVFLWHKIMRCNLNVRLSKGESTSAGVFPRNFAILSDFVKHAVLPSGAQSLGQ